MFDIGFSELLVIAVVALVVLGPERRWWEGEAVNPYPILRGEAPLP